MEPVKALRSLPIEDLLLPILVQLAIIIVVARVFGILLRYLGQPSVVGEVCAGVLLGPSVFGALFPGFFALVFQPVLPNVPIEFSRVLLPKFFAVMSQIGLIFLLFLVGLEADFSHLQFKGRAAAAISLTGIAVPFGLGFGLAFLIYPSVVESNSSIAQDRLGFALFLGVALSITAIPVLGRIMMELNITRTRIGSITLTSAAIDDAVGWILLATVAAVVKSGFSPGETFLMALQTVAFGIGMYVIARPILIRLLHRSMEKNGGDLTVTALAMVIALVFICSIITNRIGIFAIFGAFVLGAILSDQEAFRQAIHARLRDIVTAFFLPIFFMNTGLRTEIGSLHSAELWLICGVIVVVSVIGKLAGCGLAARLTGFSLRESAMIGVLMNTRGLMGLVVVTLGYEMGVIPKTVYCMLVIMAIATTIMTTPLIMALMPGTELESSIRASEFAHRKGVRKVVDPSESA